MSDDMSILAKRRALAAMTRRARGRLPGLGDVQDSLYYRTLKTRGGAGQGEEEGPVSAPVIEGEHDLSGEDLLAEIVRLLDNLPERMCLALRTKFPIWPREGVPFVASNPLAALAGLATAVVAQFQVPERFTGFLEYVGTQVVPAGAAVNWSLALDGQILTDFDNQNFPVNTLANPMRFYLELVQSCTVQLIATETAGVPVNVGGSLIGWTEFMGDYKPYGADSATGLV